MKYQVFLISDDKKMCSFTISAKTPEEATQKAINLAMQNYNKKMKLFKIFEEN